MKNQLKPIKRKSCGSVAPRPDRYIPKIDERGKVRIAGEYIGLRVYQ